MTITKSMASKASLGLLAVMFAMVSMSATVFAHGDNNAERKGKYQFQFAKEWAGDEVDLENVEVTFFIGKTAWQIGDEAVPVKPGTVLEPLTEEVTGLPENCSYESDLPASYTVFEEYVPSDAQRQNHDNNDKPMPKIDTLTVTNTVTCEDDVVVDTPAVLADTTTTPTPQVTAKPVGAADAGDAGTNALLGLFGSAIVISFGAVIRKFSL